MRKVVDWIRRHGVCLPCFALGVALYLGILVNATAALMDGDWSEVIAWQAFGVYAAMDQIKSRRERRRIAETERSDAR